jgi:hypothetical protein
MFLLNNFFMGGEMMKNRLYALVLVILVSAICVAQEQHELQVDEMVFCTAIEDRQPVVMDTVFKANVERVYCYTKLTGSLDTTTITHSWYFKDEEVAKVNLSVKAKTWRTWSSKKLLEIWIGKWRVDVVSADGTVLRSEEFIIKP